MPINSEGKPWCWFSQPLSAPDQGTKHRRPSSVGLSLNNYTTKSTTAAAAAAAAAAATAAAATTAAATITVVFMILCMFHILGKMTKSKTNQEHDQ